MDATTSKVTSMLAAASFGQTLGSATGGSLFGALAQRSLGCLTVPSVVILGLLLARRDSGRPTPPNPVARLPSAAPTITESQKS